LVLNPGRQIFTTDFADGTDALAWFQGRVGSRIELTQRAKALPWFQGWGAKSKAETLKTES
jgi:hypothetical protein